MLFMGAVSAADWTVNPGGSIQSAINNSSANDTIIVNDNNGAAYIYTENLVINKKLSLKAKTGGNVTIRAVNSSKSTIIVYNAGNGSTIQGFNINGSTNYVGIYLNESSNCIITGNKITNNYHGIYLYKAYNTLITQNTLINNNDGICVVNSTVNVKFNSISGNTRYGLFVLNNGNANATNNWWGKNTPTYIYSTNWPSTYDIWNQNCIINYNPWLVLTINSTDTAHAGEDSEITADLTHNSQGNDTSPGGNVPDGTPINFTTTLGTIITPATTRNGKAITTLSNSMSGASISASLDSQTVSTSVNVLGVYNERTSEWFDTINAAISDNDTLDNDTIIVKEGIYTQNVYVNRKVTIKAVSSNVIMQAVSTTSYIFNVYGNGSGTIIQGFTIKDATSGIGIRLAGVSNCTVMGNTITNNQYGIFLTSTNNNITITENTITGGQYGINPQYSNAVINFNRIYGNSKFGLVSQGTSNITATNNWWGRSTPTFISSVNWVSTYYDIYKYNCVGSLTYSPYFPSDIGFTIDTIKTAAGTVKNYIETNHQLPSSVTISGIQVSMPQFLKLATKAVLNINNEITTSILLGNVGNAPNPTENMTNGIILDDEFIEMASIIKSFTDANRYAPNYLSNISLGDSIRYESLVYMYSLIMNSYNSTDGTLSEDINVNPWIVVSYPNKVYNLRTNEMFNTIQDTINDTDTLNNDTLKIGDGVFTENVVVNKRLNICSLNGNSTIIAANIELPVFSIGINGNGTTLQNLIIKGSTSSSGIYVTSNDNSITGNNITGNLIGIWIENSIYNEISGNNIINNTGNGVLINMCLNSTISNNIIKYNNQNGIKIIGSGNENISSNVVSNNNVDGIYLENTTADVNFNIITGNARYGLYNTGNGTLNATNNWWGTNNNPYNIYVMGNVNCDTWLVLNVTSSRDWSNRTGICYNNIINTDLTKNNQGEDTSKDGNIPDNVPIIFLTDLGTIVAPTNTSKGRASAILNGTVIGVANVSVTLNSPAIIIPVNVVSVEVLGIYNNRTGQGFETIQAAIGSNSTINGDIINLKEGTYTENVVLNKKVTLKPLTEDNVTLNALNKDRSIFVINIGGSGSVIQDLIISTDSELSCILFNSTSNCTIRGNVLMENKFGILLYNSTNNTITQSEIKDNYYGIYLIQSNNNNISGCTIRDNIMEFTSKIQLIVSYLELM